MAAKQKNGPLTITYRGRKIRLGSVMLGALQWALKHPGRWQNIGKEKPRILAIKRLEKEGLVEILEYSNQYRVPKVHKEDQSN